MISYPLIRGYRDCANRVAYDVCNWLVPANAAGEQCPACLLNRTVPYLGENRNIVLWRRVEQAKRRMLYALFNLGIQVPSKSEDPQTGLTFEILSSAADPSVSMGHLDGVITITLEEADDTYRQVNRQQLGEKCRTLLGHFRHEIAHYLWFRHLSALVDSNPLRVACRERFGDEAGDYGAALTHYYATGAPVGWERRFITAYASSHPAEDWAETWAHYFQIMDGLETCQAMGMETRFLKVDLQEIPRDAGVLPQPLTSAPEEDDAFLALLQRWNCLSVVLNEVAGSFGQGALYPFVITIPVAQKLRLAHHFAQMWAR